MWIRRATSNDIGGIQAVARDSWESDYPFLSRESLRQGIHEWYTNDRIRRALSDPSTLLLVAEEDGRVVGFSHAWANFRQRTGNILRMYVHPGYRGRGIGRALYDESAAALAAEGIVRLRAETLAENPLGNEFYRGLGFVKTGERWTNVGGNWLLENTYAREGIGREPDEGRRPVRSDGPRRRRAGIRSRRRRRGVAPKTGCAHGTRRGNRTAAASARRHSSVVGISWRGPSQRPPSPLPS